MEDNLYRFTCGTLVINSDSSMSVDTINQLSFSLCDLLIYMQMQWIEKFLLKLRFEGALFPSASLAWPCSAKSQRKIHISLPRCPGPRPSKFFLAEASEWNQPPPQAGQGFLSKRGQTRPAYPSQVRQGPPVQAVNCIKALILQAYGPAHEALQLSIYTHLHFWSSYALRSPRYVTQARLGKGWH